MLHAGREMRSYSAYENSDKKALLIRKSVSFVTPLEDDTGSNFHFPGETVLERHPSSGCEPLRLALTLRSRVPLRAWNGIIASLSRDIFLLAKLEIIIRHRSGLMHVVSNI